MSKKVGRYQARISRFGDNGSQLVIIDTKTGKFVWTDGEGQALRGSFNDMYRKADILEVKGSDPQPESDPYSTTDP